MIIIYDDDLSGYVQRNECYIIECLKDNDIDITLKNIDDFALTCIDDDLSQLKQAAQYFDNVGNYDNIIIEAELGLWNGKHKATKQFKTLAECLLKYCEDQNTFYFKRKNTTLTLAACHHDGINIFKFYYVKNGKKHAINYNIFMNGY
jgi:hypothetical protein